MKYKVVRRRKTVLAGVGKTINISRQGILFSLAADPQAPPAGSQVELAMEWPVMLNEHCPLNLVVFGRVVRAEGDKAAISFNKYQFRTRALRALARLATVPANGFLV